MGGRDGHHMQLSTHWQWQALVCCAALSGFAKLESCCALKVEKLRRHVKRQLRNSRHFKVVCTPS